MLDFNTVNRFFDNLVDKYHVTTVHDAIHNRFIATCKYLADNTYPRSCKRIIIYFSGHGYNESIQMENYRGVKIAEILSYFHNENCREMERILLLDAPCSAENIKCEPNELVACASSRGRHPDPRFLWTGGLWTKKIWKLMMLTGKLTNNLVTSLENVLEDMKGQEDEDVQIPSIKNEIPENQKIIFTCKLNCNQGRFSCIALLIYNECDES